MSEVPDSRAMKDTVFKFSVEIESELGDAAVEKLRDTLSKIEGVQAVNAQFDGYQTQLHVQVCFENSDSAKKLHRKVMTKIRSEDGVRITSMTTKLTDIF